MATRNYQGIKFQGDSFHPIEDSLTIEEALQVNINGVPFTVSMRTPGNDEALVRGLLHSEGILEDTGLLPVIQVETTNTEGVVTVVNVDIPENKLDTGYSNSRSLLSVSSCGICGKTELKDLEVQGEAFHDEPILDKALLPDLFAAMHRHQSDFKQSGGTHAAAVFSMDGTLICAMEDIGRHNAVDKVIGELILTGQLGKAKILTVSGRISYEIVVKCFKGRIPYLAAVSAPSSLAVDYAKELGITLFGFCRGDRGTCYSNPYRIKKEVPQS